jgi:hypothetical protein
MELRLWAINQLNVLRSIESAPRRWLSERDKLALSGEDIAVLNLARPLFERAELDEDAWVSWQRQLFLTRWPDNAKNEFAGCHRGGLLSRATGEAAYYRELIRITWERLRNLATMRPDRLIPLPEEPSTVADNLAARRALDTVLAFSAAWIQAGESEREEGSQSPRITLIEANEKAKLLAKADRSFVKEPSIRKWAEAIGCSTGLVVKLPFWRALMEKSGRGRKDTTPKPKAVSLTSNLEAAVGEGARNEVLERLIGDQEADFEPSPLEGDPPEGRPRTVRTRKRL